MKYSTAQFLLLVFIFMFNCSGTPERNCESCPLERLFTEINETETLAKRNGVELQTEMKIEATLSRVLNVSYNPDLQYKDNRVFIRETIQTIKNDYSQFIDVSYAYDLQRLIACARYQNLCLNPNISQDSLTKAFDEIVTLVGIEMDSIINKPKPVSPDSIKVITQNPAFPKPSTINISLVINSSCSRLSEILLDGEPAFLVDNLPTTKIIQVPNIQKRYELEFVVEQDTFNYGFLYFSQEQLTIPINFECI